MPRLHEHPFAIIPVVHCCDRVIDRAHAGFIRSNPVHRRQQLHAIRRLEALDESPYARDMGRQSGVALISDECLSFCKRTRRDGSAIDRLLASRFAGSSETKPGPLPPPPPKEQPPPVRWDAWDVAA